MSSEALYEQYKDALKRGHVASLRGRLEEALLAYAEASRIAPERATPHASAGTALLRHRRPAEALTSYEVALSIAPRDEAALLGRAQALADLGRRSDAADAFDALAEAQAAGGRLADAVDAARRGLELAEGRERRRTLERLIARLRSSDSGEPGRVALERALQVLEGPAVRIDAAPAGPVPEPGPPDQAASGAAPEDEAVSPARGASGSGALGQDDGEGTGAAADAGIPEPQAASKPGFRASRQLPASATEAELAARAAAAVDAGVAQPAVDALLDLATLHAREGRIDAALDACYTAVSFDPGNVALHLALVELYQGRGWDVLVDEKLALLQRLARLDGDARALADIAGARVDHG